MSTEKKQQNLDMYAGEYRDLMTTVYENDTTQFKNVTGSKIKYVLSRNVDSTGILILSTTDVNSKIVITGGTAGELTITLESSFTTSLSGKYYHEARLIDGSTKSGVIFSGDVLISKSNTLN